MWDSC
jgi:hypothetical protein